MTTWQRVLILVLGVCAPFVTAHAQINSLLSQGEARAAENERAQAGIEKVADQTVSLVSEYRNLLKVVDGLQVYNGLLQRQVDAQEAEKGALSEAMTQVALIERQIVPLMVRMIDSLEDFVGLDVPFLKEEREKRVDRLRTLMERSDVTAAEKFRNVLEAYSIENDYGRTIEAYKDTVDIGGNTREADFLRIGRVALVYQTVGGQYTGAWDREQNAFIEVPAATYKQAVTKGLRVARKQVAPDLLVLPVMAAEEVGQ